jgi:hypothetical protein
VGCRKERSRAAAVAPRWLHAASSALLLLLLLLPQTTLNNTQIPGLYKIRFIGQNTLSTGAVSVLLVFGRCSQRPPPRANPDAPHDPAPALGKKQQPNNQNQAFGVFLAAGSFVQCGRH